ncbi:MAG: retropepsin-like domain-containing protein, partial [Planctomycetota bacterium]|nr:retropepsin-like domain-containing protein [Planctomycetota bacterium]
RVTFDFARNEVTLEPHGQPARPGMLLVNVTINGRSWPMLVDSGASRLTLEPWAAVELGQLEGQRQPEFAKQVGAAGSGKRRTVRLKAITVAGRTFSNVKTYVINTFGELRFSGRRVAGLLGLRGFGKLVWTLDYATRDLEVSG